MKHAVTTSGHMKLWRRYMAAVKAQQSGLGTEAEVTR